MVQPWEREVNTPEIFTSPSPSEMIWVNIFIKLIICTQFFETQMLPVVDWIFFVSIHSPSTCMHECTSCPLTLEFGLVLTNGMLTDDWPKSWKVLLWWAGLCSCTFELLKEELPPTRATATAPQPGSRMEMHGAELPQLTCTMSNLKTGSQ
jgi:hypothetical protein